MFADSDHMESKSLQDLNRRPEKFSFRSEFRSGAPHDEYEYTCAYVDLVSTCPARVSLESLIFLGRCGVVVGG
jgi:hypothetical protein